MQVNLLFVFWEIYMVVARDWEVEKRCKNQIDRQMIDDR